MPRVLSGIQPSGDLHLGNYFGALRQWLDFQNKHDCFFLIVDLHSLTSLQDAAQLKRNISETVISYLACGLDPSKCVISRQSHVPAHAELSWILSTVTPMGMLERAHAYKDKTAKGLSASVGLFTYPVLMAADILMYCADLVPVGKDQKQHVEMTRDIAEKFHHAYNTEVFHIPEPFIPEEVAVVPGLDGQKMSKSYGNTIPLFCSEAELKKKVMSIVTDSKELKDKKDPEESVIYHLYKLVAPEKSEEMAGKFKAGGYGYGEAKKDLLKGITQFLKPLWENRKKIEIRKGYVDEVLRDGAMKARCESNILMEKVRDAVGL